MKQLKNAVSKMSFHVGHKYNTLAEDKEPLSSGEEDISPVWTTGQEFQFYVPWLWNESPGPPPEKLHPDRQVVRIPRPPYPPGSMEECREAWIQERVTCAVKDLVGDEEHYPTCTDRQLKEWHYDRTKAWKRFNVVQSKCDLSEVNIPGYDGVLPVEMTTIIIEVSICRNQASSTCLEWLTLPSPGKCLERIKDHVRIYLTPECSIHVHIRPSRMLEFDMVSFKKMASLLWLAEERLDKLYHPSRNNPDSPFHRSLSRFSNLALDEDPLITGSLDDYAAILGPVKLAVAEKDKIATIWQTSDCYQLRELLRIHPSIGKHDYPAYNFFNLFMSSDKQTIEFRKMESMIDAQVIDAWIEAFLLLADFCMTCSIKTFRSIIENLGKPENVYNPWNLLRDIGCKPPTIEVLRRKYIQQWISEKPVSCPVSRASTSPSIDSSKSAPRARLRDAIRDGAVKIGGKVASGYSYGG